jgi:AAA domain
MKGWDRDGFMWTIQAMPINKGNVVWLDFENGKRRTHERFSALGRTLQLPGDAPISYYSMPTPWLDSKDKSQIEELAKLVNKHQGKLVTIDNLGNISGGADENTTEMVEIFAHLRWLVEETGTVLIVIHHRRKSDPKNGRAGDALRGHSSIEAALDLALLIDRTDNSQTINIKPTKVRGADIQPFSATFSYLHDDSGELKEARFFRAHGDGVTVVSQRWKVIYQCAREEPLNKTTLAQRAHDASNGNYGINLLAKDIDLMVQEGYLLLSKGNNNAQLLTRNPTKAL